MAQHDWKPHDDLVALYLYRYGTHVVSFDDVERKLGIPAAAMKMRMANFKALDGQGGLGNVSRQSQQVYAANRSTPREELERAVLEILDRDVPRSRTPTTPYLTSVDVVEALTGLDCSPELSRGRSGADGRQGDLDESGLLMEGTGTGRLRLIAARARLWG